MAEQEQKSTNLNISELLQSELADKLYIATFVSMANTTARISLSDNDSEKKEQ